MYVFLTIFQFSYDEDQYALKTSCKGLRTAFKTCQEKLQGSPLSAGVQRSLISSKTLVPEDMIQSKSLVPVVCWSGCEEEKILGFAYGLMNFLRSLLLTQAFNDFTDEFAEPWERIFPFLDHQPHRRN